MYLVMVIAVYAIFAKKFVNWTRWKEFYPTVQYFIICNLLYNFIFFNHTLWAYKAVTVKWLNHTLIEISFSFFIIPVVIMIYLQHFPEKKHKLIYIGVWIAYFSFIEFLFHRRGLFVYDHGWNLIWSTIFNAITFGMLRLHYKKPLAAILFSVPLIILLLLFFHPLLQELK